MITKNDWRLVKQHIVDVMIELVVEDFEGNIVDILHGVCSGNNNIDVNSGSSNRRTASFSISPSKQLYNISEQSLVWLNKMVKVNVGVLDQRDRTSIHTRYIGTNYAYSYKGLRSWYTQGVYLYSNANATYDVSTNVMTIELNDLASRLDGTINGQVGGAITAIYPAYEEDEQTGEPLHYNNIRGAIEKTLHSGGLMPYWEAYHYDPKVESGVYTINLKLESHTGSVTLDAIELTGDASTEDFDEIFYSVLIKKQGNIITLFARKECYYEEQVWPAGSVLDSFIIGYTSPHALIFGHEAEHPEFTFIVDDIGEYYAMPHSNEPDYDYMGYRATHPLWNMIPYDLEFSLSCSIWDILSEIIGLYPDYDAAFDEQGIFRVKMISTEYTDENDFDLSDYVDMVISEGVSTDLSTIRNVCEVWGESLDADWYAEDVAKGARITYEVIGVLEENVYKLNTKITFYSSHLGTSFVEEHTDSFIESRTNFDVSYHGLRMTYDGTTLTFWALRDLHYESQTFPAGSVIGSIPFGEPASVWVTEYIFGSLDDQGTTRGRFVIVCEGFKKYEAGQRIGVTFSSGSANKYHEGDFMQVNDLDPLGVVDSTTKAYLKEDILDSEHIHIFQLVKIFDEVLPNGYGYQWYYVGVSQSHALDVLTDGTTGGPVKWIDPDTDIIYHFDEFSKEYYQHFYNCRTVNFTIIENSPYTVQKLGNRLDVKQEGEFSNIRTDELAKERAVYENWKNSRLTDNVNITTKLIPFITPFMKTCYRKNGSDKVKDYAIQSVSHDLDSGTTTINMYTFYPLYKRPEPGEHGLTYKRMGGFLNENLYGDEDDITE